MRPPDGRAVLFQTLVGELMKKETLLNFFGAVIVILFLAMMFCDIVDTLIKEWLVK